VLSTPQSVKKFRRQDGFPGTEILALLVDCQMLFKVDAARRRWPAGDRGRRQSRAVGFHDLLFHTHSTEGRQANPLGGLYPYAGDDRAATGGAAALAGEENRSAQARRTPAAVSPLAKLMRERHSTRDFDDRQPITLPSFRGFSIKPRGSSRNGKAKSTLATSDSPVVRVHQPALSVGGSAYELELYLTVANCAGLARGFYHYDADRHALVPIGTRARRNSTRSWRPPNLPWTRRPRRRS
jgi:hypothetical protein